MSIRATLDASEISTRRWDLLVAGAGPAGAMLAHRVAAEGMAVLLVDRQAFPRDKVCGGCLSARTIEELHRAGLGAIVDNLGAPSLRRLRLGGCGRAADLSLPGGIAVSRRALDAALVEAAVATGAHFLPRYSVSIGPVCGDTRKIELLSSTSHHTARATIVADASGLGSKLVSAAVVRRAQRQRIGCNAIVEAANEAYRAGTIYMAVGRSGYVGATRLEDGRLNVAAALDQRALREHGPGALVDEILGEAGFGPIDGTTTASWSGTPVLSQQPRQRAGARVFSVGDAAGYVEPFTGEGVGWALRSAALLAPIVSRAVRSWSDDMMAVWSETYNTELARSQRACRGLAWLLRRPLAVRCAVSVLAHRPALAAPFVRHLHAGRVAGEGGSWR